MGTVPVGGEGEAVSNALVGVVVEVVYATVQKPRGRGGRGWRASIRKMDGLVSSRRKEEGSR